MTLDAAPRFIPVQRPRHTLLGIGGDAFLARVRGVVARVADVEGRAGFLRALAALPEGNGCTLDLVGHTMDPDVLLRLGDWTIDGRDPDVLATFGTHATLLSHCGITDVRLLGCNTARTPAGRATMIALAERLGLEVWGMAGAISGTHFDAHGFEPSWRFLLRRASDFGAVLPRPELVEAPPTWPSHLATADEARAILGLVREDEGSPIAPRATPRCELVLRVDAMTRIVQVVHDETFLQQDDHGRAFAFPVSDPAALRSIIDAVSHRESQG